MFMPMMPQAPESSAPMRKPKAGGPAQAGQQPDDQEQHYADHRDGPVLAPEIGDRAFADRSRDLAHARIAVGQAQDAADLPDPVDDGE
jgi:hypothetical protein